MYLIRVHHVSKTCLRRHVMQQLRNKYIQSVVQKKVLTQRQADDWLLRKFGRSESADDNWELTVSVDIPEDLLNAVLIEDSMDSFYDEKCAKQRKKLRYHRTLRSGKCPICMCIGKRLVSIHPCCHLFHRKCILEWSRWQDVPTCPVCQVAIYVDMKSPSKKRKRCTRKDLAVSASASPTTTTVEAECLL